MLWSGLIGVYRCGPCPVAAIRERCLLVPYDTPFLYASVDGDVRRVIVDNGHVVGETLDSKAVGRLICTKSVGSSCLSNLTHSYKGLKSKKALITLFSFCFAKNVAVTEINQTERLTVFFSSSIWKNTFSFFFFLQKCIGMIYEVLKPICFSHNRNRNLLRPNMH